MWLELANIRKANTLKALFKEWREYLENKFFHKKAINILSIYLHHFEGTLDKSRARFNLASFPEKKNTKIILHVIIYYVNYVVNHISWILLHFLLDFLI